MPPITRSEITPIVSEMGPSLALRHRTSVHIAFLFGRTKTPIAFGVNRPGNRSCGAGFSTNTIHAERSVLKKVDHKKLQGAVLVVVRVNSAGQLVNSRPCHECQKHLEKCMRTYGLRCVYYS